MKATDTITGREIKVMLGKHLRAVQTARRAAMEEWAKNHSGITSGWFDSGDHKMLMGRDKAIIAIASELNITRAQIAYTMRRLDKEEK